MQSRGMSFLPRAKPGPPALSTPCPDCAGKGTRENRRWRALRPLLAGKSAEAQARLLLIWSRRYGPDPQDCQHCGGEGRL
jgi:hypothetical protein